MVTRRYLLDAGIPVKCGHVGPSIPAIIVLLGYHSIPGCPADWQQRWPHGADPMYRLGWNCPKRDEVTRRVLESECMDYSLKNLVTLGRRVLDDLPEVYSAAVHRVGVAHCALPLDYAFPYVGAADILSTADCRLCGMDVELELGV